MHCLFVCLLASYVFMLNSQTRTNLIMNLPILNQLIIIHQTKLLIHQNSKSYQKHKVWNITDIISSIYSKYPEPPVTTVLIQFSRALIEEEADTTDNTMDKYHIMNHHNLKEINRLVQEGMWGGQVKVVEAGSAIVEEAGDPFYKYYSNIAGGIVNLFLAVQSNIFVGTEVSTYSSMAVNMRYFRDLKENYFYRPDGLFHVTPPDRKKPFWFAC